jgi:hypothetical protein
LGNLRIAVCQTEVATRLEFATSKTPGQTRLSLLDRKLVDRG